MKIHELINKTKNILQKNSHDLDKIKKIYNDDIEGWEDYVLLKDNYTRRLVFRNDLFQLIVMTWPKDYKSFIHDHNKNECIFKILKGSFNEKTYTIKENKLIQKEIKTINTNNVGSINDDIGCHSVINTSNDYAVSLHLYIRSKDTSKEDIVNIYLVDNEMNFNKKIVHLNFDN